VMLLSRVKFPQWSSFCLFRGVDEWIPVEWRDGPMLRESARVLGLCFCSAPLKFPVSRGTAARIATDSQTSPAQDLLPLPFW
jgi:hypothetical protein